MPSRADALTGGAASCSSDIEAVLFDVLTVLRFERGPIAGRQGCGEPAMVVGKVRAVGDLERKDDDQMMFDRTPDRAEAILSFQAKSRNLWLFAGNRRCLGFARDDKKPNARGRFGKPPRRAHDKTKSLRPSRRRC